MKLMVIYTILIIAPIHPPTHKSIAKCSDCIVNLLRSNVISVHVDTHQVSLPKDIRISCMNVCIVLCEGLPNIHEIQHILNGVIYPNPLQSNEFWNQTKHIVFPEVMLTTSRPSFYTSLNQYHCFTLRPVEKGLMYQATFSFWCWLKGTSFGIVPMNMMIHIFMRMNCVDDDSACACVLNEKFRSPFWLEWPEATTNLI